MADVFAPSFCCSAVTRVRLFGRRSKGPAGSTAVWLGVSFVFALCPKLACENGIDMDHGRPMPGMESSEHAWERSGIARAWVPDPEAACSRRLSVPAMFALCTLVGRVFPTRRCSGTHKAETREAQAKRGTNEAKEEEADDGTAAAPSCLLLLLLRRHA